MVSFLMLLCSTDCMIQNERLEPSVSYVIDTRLPHEKIRSEGSRLNASGGVDQASVANPPSSFSHQIPLSNRTGRSIVDSLQISGLHRLAKKQVESEPGPPGSDLAPGRP